MAEDLTTLDVAEELGISRQFVPKLIKAGRLKGRKVGRDWLVTRAELERFRKLPPVPPGRKPASKRKPPPVKPTGRSD